MRYLLNSIRYSQKLILLYVFILGAINCQAASTWTGTVNRQWANGANWAGSVPNSLTNVVIEATANSPSIAEGVAAQCRKLQITSGGRLNIEGGTLTFSDASARMAVRLLIDQQKVIAYSGQGRIIFDSSGTNLVLRAEEFDEQAQSPSPKDLEVEIPSGVSQRLTWSSGRGAVSHNLYFSSKASEVIEGETTALIGNQAGTTFDTPVLDANTVYYWRVDEVSDSGTRQGDIWSFRTDKTGVARPTLGVIRWDMYSGMAATQEQELGYLPGDYGFLAPDAWNWRAPFFCRYTQDVTWVDHDSNGSVGPLWFNYPHAFSRTQETTEQEIAFAGTAGAQLDYWIFGTAPASAGGNGWGLYWNLDAFLLSERRLEMNYALMYRLDPIDDWAELDLAIEELVWHGKQSNYQTVLLDRPIIYFISYKKLSVALGDPEDGSTVNNLATAVQKIRDAFAEANLPNPYLAASAVPAHARKESNWIDGGGFDAGGDYRGAYGGSLPPGTLFSEMGGNIEPYWNFNAQSLSADLIPAAPCGANSEPRTEKGHGGNTHYQEPLSGDLTTLMHRAMNYIDASPEKCAARTFSMYAWNEHSEGGFLCPLIGDSPDYVPDTWRLDEVGLAINSYSSDLAKVVLVMLRADGLVFHSRSDAFNAIPSVDLAYDDELLVAGAVDGSYVYGLLDSGEVRRADLFAKYPHNYDSLGSFVSSLPLQGIDVKDGHIYVVDSGGAVYKDFKSDPEQILSNEAFVDIAVSGQDSYRGLCRHNGNYTWSRDEDNTYYNYSNNGVAKAITSESGSSYFALQESGDILRAQNISIGNMGTQLVDLTVDHNEVFYGITNEGLVGSLSAGTVKKELGNIDTGSSEFVAIDWVSVLPKDLNALARKPNVIVIVTDDHGFTDLGIYGIDDHVQTPNMDTLAANGALMTHGYVTAPQCVPSRGGMILGSYSYRYGLRSNKDGYLPLTDSEGNAVRTHAQDIKAYGYATGLVGKWHLNRSESNFPGYEGDYSDYHPRNRGFDDYFYGFHQDFEANFDPATGNSVAIDTVYNHPHGRDGRVLIQGQAANMFIKKHKEKPFYLYFSPYGPHVPRLSSNYEAVIDFPLKDYPMYDSVEDQVRREGLAFIKMIDAAVGDLMQVLRDNNLEEDTLIFFVSDNGANPKLWDTWHPGSELWVGSENIPRRGEKGSLFEGGINVPMWAYWKGVIPGAQTIDEPVLSLDFMATAMQLAAGRIPDKYDGVDLLPRLKNEASTVDRPNPIYWNYGDPGAGEVAIRKGDWKLRRNGAGDFLFNILSDPNELFNHAYSNVTKLEELASDLENFMGTLPAYSPVKRGVSRGDNNYIYGARDSTAIEDERYLEGQIYPAPIVSEGAPVDSDGDGLFDQDEVRVGRDPNSACDLAFNFEKPGDFRYYSEGSFEGWRPSKMNPIHVSNNLLKGNALASDSRLIINNLNFNANEVPSIVVRMKANAGDMFRFFWSTEASNDFDSSKLFVKRYNTDRYETIIIPLSGDSEWDNQRIQQMRINPVNVATEFEIDFICASNGDLDKDGFLDDQESIAGTNAKEGKSFFKLTANHSRELTWKGQRGRQYKIWHSSSLSPAVWTVLHEIDALSAEEIIRYSLSTTDPVGFYRLEVSYP